MNANDPVLDQAVDWNRVLGASEGGRYLKGYLILLSPPRHYYGESVWDAKWVVEQRTRAEMGVTIASGFDIGQHSPQQINALPISKSAKTKMVPFAAPLTGKRAGEALHKAGGLSIDDADALAIDRVVPRQILAKLIDAYDKAVDGGWPFLLLPKAIRTALFSFAYQHGPDWGKPGRTGPMGQAFWRAIVAQDWNAAIRVLEGYHEKDVHRRRGEAQLIKSGKSLFKRPVFVSV